MTAILQIIRSADVSVDGKLSGSAENGLLILLGCAEGDTFEDADLLCDKIAKLRIFTDAEDKMNLSIKDIDGQILLVSNFTLAASCRRGRRPDFGGCMKSAEAEPMFEYFRDRLRDEGIPTETGVFGADMTISAVCEGPVTIILDSEVLKAPRSAK